VALQVEDVDLVRESSLVERSRLGDADAFGELYRRHHDRLLRYCSYQLRSRHDAEDAVQEAFAKAWRSLPTFAGENFYAWLRVIARNLCADTGRRRSRVEPQAEIELGTAEAADAGLGHSVDLQMLRLAIERLPDRHRTALQWREQEGLSYEEIAARAGVSLGTVESLLWRARQGLRRQFEIVAGPEGLLAGLPGIGWAIVRLRRLHVRASEVASRWATPIVGWGNFGVLGAVGVASTVSGAFGGPPAAAVAPSTIQMTVAVTPRVDRDAVLGLTREGSGTVAPGSSEAPSAPRASRVVLADPMSTGTTGRREAAGDPLRASAGNAWVGVDPTTAANYVQSVVTTQVPIVLQGGLHG